MRTPPGITQWAPLEQIAAYYLLGHVLLRGSAVFCAEDEARIEVVATRSCHLVQTDCLHLNATVIVCRACDVLVPAILHPLRQDSCHPV
jgi:hypothetical protein